MIKVLMVCHGNICRSPMAEFVFLDLIKKRKISHKFQVDSAGTSTEALGKPVHPGTVKKLQSENIPMTQRKAVQLKKDNYEYYDWLLCMDEMNVKNTLKIVGSDSKNKIYKLLNFSDQARDIADPWFTGNFDQTFDDVLEGCEGFLTYLIENKKM